MRGGGRPIGSRGIISFPRAGERGIEPLGNYTQAAARYSHAQILYTANDTCISVFNLLKSVYGNCSVSFTIVLRIRRHFGGTGFVIIKINNKINNMNS